MTKKTRSVFAWYRRCSRVRSMQQLSTIIWCPVWFGPVCLALLRLDWGVHGPLSCMAWLVVCHVAVSWGADVCDVGWWCSSVGLLLLLCFLMHTDFSMARRHPSWRVQ